MVRTNERGKDKKCWREEAVGYKVASRHRKYFGRGLAANRTAPELGTGKLQGLHGPATFTNITLRMDFSILSVS